MVPLVNPVETLYIPDIRVCVIAHHRTFIQFYFSKVARSRIEFALEGANKELDSALQVAQCKVNERLLTTEDQIRQRLRRNLCELQLEYRKQRYLKPDHSMSY